MNFRRSSSTNNLATPLGSGSLAGRLARPSFGLSSAAGGRKRSSSTSSSNRPSVDVYKTSTCGGSVSKPFFGSSSKPSRPSSTYGRAGILAKDPRPLPNCPPDVRHKWAQSLMEGLIEHSYPGNLTEAQLRQATNTRDVVAMFEFLYKFFEPNYKMEGKLEDEMPKALKGLGYPFELKKSDFKTITTPNSWPNILAALVWLKELLMFATNVRIEDVILPGEFEDEQDDININVAVYKLNCSGYRKFREGVVDFTDIDAELENQLMSTWESDGSVAKLRTDNEKLREVHKSMCSQRPLHERLKETNEALFNDCQSLQKYNEDMTAFNEKLQNMLDTADTEQQQLDAEIPLIRQDIADKQDRISRQELSPADVQRLVFSKQQLDSQIEKLTAEREKKEKDAFDLQCDIQKHIDLLNQKSGEFVEKASSLLALMGPEFSRMVDPKQFNLFDPKFEESFLKTYKPGLLYCKKKSNEMVHEVRAEIIEINKTITQLEEELRASTVEVEDLDYKIASIEADRATLLEDCRAQLNEKRKELDEVKESYQEFLRTKLSGTDESVRERDKLMNQLDSVTAEQDKEVEVHSNELREALQLFEGMKRMIKELESELERSRGIAMEKIRQLQDY